jgi:multicomponent Na+:H+ antiporter subunit E
MGALRGNARHAARLAGSAWRRAVLLGLVWWALVEGEPRSFVSGLPVVAAALAVSLWLMPVRRPRPTLAGVVAFLPYFLQKSFLGGLDVALRAFRPTPPLRPGFADHPLRLVDEGPVILFVNLISLLPGTLSARLDPPSLRVHVLDTSLPIAAELALLEEKIAHLYGLSLGAAGEAAEVVG